MYRPKTALGKILIAVSMGGALAFTAVATAPAEHQAHAESLWHIVTDTLLYSDTDNVQIVAPQVGVQRDLEDDEGSIGARVVTDVISAASVDVISEATTRFTEVRTEVDLNASKTYGDKLVPSVSYRYSHEPDYVSHGLRFAATRPVVSDDTTLGLGYGVTIDSIGLHGTPRSNFSETKFTHAADASLTQVLGKNSLVRIAYTMTIQSGFLEKPYRHVPLFTASGLAAAKMDGVALDVHNFADYAISARPLDEVPDLRVRHAVAVRGLRYIEDWNASIKLDYQYYFDSWDMSAHTLELAYYRQLNERWRARGFLRYYLQDAASFWNEIYVVPDEQTIPRWRTIDRSLSSYSTVSAGGRIEWQKDPWSVYLSTSAMYTSFHDYLFLDTRLALIAQGGVQWLF